MIFLTNRLLRNLDNCLWFPIPFCSRVSRIEFARYIRKKKWDEKRERWREREERERDREKHKGSFLACHFLITVQEPMWKFARDVLPSRKSERSHSSFSDCDSTRRNESSRRARSAMQKKKRKKKKNLSLETLVHRASPRVCLIRARKKHP